MSTSRRDFLKAIGLTTGVAVAGGAGGLVLSNFGEKEQESNFESLLDYPLEENIEELLVAHKPLAQKSIDYPKFVKPIKENGQILPESWARECLAILEESMVVGSLVSRDFCGEVMCYGDIINIRRPASFTVSRKGPNDPIEHGFMGSLSSEQVVLKDQLYTTFQIKDGDYTRDPKYLSEMYFRPAMVSMGASIDGLILDKTNKCSAILSSDTKSILNGARKTLNRNRCFNSKRVAVLPFHMYDELDERPLDIVPTPHFKRGLAFHRDAILMSCRPMCLPPSFNGVEAGRWDQNDLSLRCIVTYDPMDRATVVSFDILLGLSVLETKGVLRLVKMDVSNQIKS